MDKIIKRLGNLLSVKSIVTLVATVVFAVLSARGDISSKDFMSIFIMIIGFYFGAQSQKMQDAIDAKSEAGNGTDD